jgi:hypothetical protein
LTAFSLQQFVLTLQLCYNCAEDLEHAAEEVFS